MDIASRTLLRHYLATQHAPRTMLELQNIHWHASALVDELQQSLDNLAALPNPQGDPEGNAEHASSRRHKPRVDNDD